MKPLALHRRNFAAVVGGTVLALAVVATPAGRHFCISALGDLVSFSERCTRFRCWTFGRAFPLDRLDPTCPQCM
jgi:hypothetical protein